MENEKKLTTAEAFTIIFKRLDKIDQNLAYIKANIDKNTNNCDKMGEHIDFVESVYDHIKHPLSFLCNKINLYTTIPSGGVGEEEQHKLPDIPKYSLE
jgi:hypothetical protein